MGHTERIFLDHASTTAVHPLVLGAMMPFFANHFASPSSPFSAGDIPRRAVEKAREQVASLIGARANEIVFTATGTEANNLAVLGAASSRKGHVLVSALEHPSVIEAAMHLRRSGRDLTILEPSSEGIVDPARLEDAMRPDTILVSVLHANYETGAILDVEAVGRVAKAHGALFHCDCIQTAGRIRVDVDAMGADLVSVSAHKLGGPKGASALYVRSGSKIAPVIFGAARERGLRPGHLNVPCIVGFGAACEHALYTMDERAAILCSLRETLEGEILARLPSSRVNAAQARRVPHISSISFEGIPADALCAWLDLEGITASPRGSLFLGSRTERLRLMGIAGDLAFGTVRFSPGPDLTAEDMVRVASSVEQACSRFREFSRMTEEDEACILLCRSTAAVRFALEHLLSEGVVCVATAVPPELEQEGGPRTAVAVPQPLESKALGVLEARGLHGVASRKIKGLCKRRGDKERRFWEEVARVKGRDPA
ncbi:MAG TPA: cysteine desulfurase family protein [Deltaproteobacteria bacterium]|nr:cysteine desulfurase family protein [Deltaproteobacteria bacterium]